MEFRGVEEVGTEMRISLSRSHVVKGRQQAQAAGCSLRTTWKGKEGKTQAGSRGIEVSLVLIKRGESTFVLIAQRTLIAAMCEIDF